MCDLMCADDQQADARGSTRLLRHHRCLLNLWQTWWQRFVQLHTANTATIANVMLLLADTRNLLNQEMADEGDDTQVQCARVASAP
jgi:hypothetical protein